MEQIEPKAQKKVGKIEDIQAYYGSTKDCPTTIHMLKHFTNEDIREVLPGFRIGFKYCEGLTLCFVWAGNALRIGTANCGYKDGRNKVAGEKIALRRAIDQFTFNYATRKALWEVYLEWRGISEGSLFLTIARCSLLGKKRFTLNRVI
jgi:hypothetical protein